MSYQEPTINRKKLETIERLRRKRECVISKNKAKKMAQLKERKRVKQTRESLFEMLQHYQLDEINMNLLNSISGKKEHQESLRKKKNMQKKLSCVSNAHEDVGRKQRNHIETDGSSCESDECEQDDSIKVQKNEETGELLCKPNEPVILNTVHESFNQHDIKDEAALKSNNNKTRIDDSFLSRIKGKQIMVERNLIIEKQRRKLPINAEEQPIVEDINENPVVIICGTTGSGKTTQIPQFLYEAGYTSNGLLIGVTEPRRIAAISMASRVGQELGDPKIASYQIRYDGNRNAETKILFMTDGVLLKELQTDCTLSRYSVIIIDEAHERSAYTDILIGLLSRICIVRLKRGYPLKLIIMSATLRLQDFLRKRLFSDIQPKVISVETRQFPVAIYFERRTPTTNYLEAAFKKVCKIHEQYPPGGILVFVTGQRDVVQLSKLLTHKYSHPRKKKGRELQNLEHREDSPENEENVVLDSEEFGTWDLDDDGNENDDISHWLDKPSPSSHFLPLITIPLYSLLPVHLQKRVFEQPPGNDSRICVISTNVAETSLTIPNIRYVVDSGKEKRKEYDPLTGVSRYIVDWCTKASADQRSGRAGRVQSGYAFRLYSSAVYEDMHNYSTPEILNKPLEQLILLLKSMNFVKIVNFPFPTPPSSEQIESAELRLSHIGALKSSANGLNDITPLGRTLVQLPLAPNFAKFVVTSMRDGLLPYSVTLVSILSVREPLVSIHSIRDTDEEEMKETMTKLIKQRKLWCSLGEARLFGDITVLLNTIGAADYAINDPKTVQSLGLRPKALNEVNKLRSQLVSILNSTNNLIEKLPTEFKMKSPSQEQLRKLRYKMVHCFPDKIAKKVHIVDAPKDAYKIQSLEEFVFIDATSMLYKEQPDYVLYQEIVQVSDKKCLQQVIVVDAEWIPDFVTFN